MSTREVRGRMVPLDRSDVDTDTIMPQQFLTSVERVGFGASVFHRWRASGQIALDDPVRVGARILVAADNFGTGSSREHAVWGLKEWGFDAVVAVRFGDIFASNCIRNGVVPAAIPAEACARLRDLSMRDPAAEATVDVEAGEVRADGVLAGFELEPIERRMLIEGLDDIALTLALEREIAAHESARPAWLPTTANPRGGTG